MLIIKGNILDAKDEILAHQVNCKGVMGAGLAKVLKEKYPANFTGYREYCRISNPLGKCYVTKQGDKYIANLFGQDGFGRDKRQTDYDALAKAFCSLKQFAKVNNLHSIAIPYMLGCGLAGGDWNIVSEIIDRIFKDSDDIKVTAYDVRPV